MKNVLLFGCAVAFYGMGWFAGDVAPSARMVSDNAELVNVYGGKAMFATAIEGQVCNQMIGGDADCGCTSQLCTQATGQAHCSKIVAEGRNICIPQVAHPTGHALNCKYTSTQEKCGVITVSEQPCDIGACGVSYGKCGGAIGTVEVNDCPGVG